MVELESNKLFHGLGDAELRILRSIAKTKHYPAGQLVFAQGEPGDGMYLVQSGRIQISTFIGQNKPQVLSCLGPGDFFGEMAVLDNECRSANAIAEEDSILIFIPRQELVQLLEESPKLAFSMVRQFSLRLRDFDRQYVEQLLQSERLSIVGRFARSIVHDFKNPLAIIGLAADLASTETASIESRKVANKRIRQQVDRLSNMINELLEFTRGSQASIVLAESNYASFVTHLVDEIRSETEQKSVRLICDEPPALNLLLDPRRLTHVFYNLIHNAMDFMPGGGTIFIRFIENEKHILTEVEDTGPGISPEIAGKLFEPFATFGKAHGTGLGLSICKRIIEDHGGRISARSEPGKGAVFSFTLPLPS